MAVKTVQVIVEGQTQTLAYNSGTGKYEKTITAPSKSSYNETGHYFPVTVKATDDAGNETSVDDTDEALGASLRLVVREKVAPVITITSPTASQMMTDSTPEIVWTVTDNDSGVDPDTIGITVDSGGKITGSAIIKSSITNGYQCSYTPTVALSDGGHTIKIDASDNDGNAAAQKSVSFTIDTVPPVLSVTSPMEGLITSEEEITVAGTASDVTSGPVTVTIKLNSGAAETVAVSGGAFSKVLTLADGDNTITVVATDKAGKSTTITRHVTLDTGAPVIHNVTITPNPVDAGATYIIAVEVTDD